GRVSIHTRMTSPVAQCGDASGAVCETTNERTSARTGFMERALRVFRGGELSVVASSRGTRIRHRPRRRCATRFQIANDRQRRTVEREDVATPVHPLLEVEMQLRAVPVRAGLQRVHI